MQATLTRRSARTQGLRLYRFTTEQFHRMEKAGLLPRDQRFELLNGQVMLMMAIGPRHASLVRYLHQYQTQQVGHLVMVDAQHPIYLDRYSEPQPDLALLRPRADFYMTHHPTPEDVLLVVEVSDSTLQADRRQKVPLYAQAGIVEVWLLAPAQQYVEVYRKPEGGQYREVVQVRTGDRLCPAAFPDVPFPVVELLGPKTV